MIQYKSVPGPVGLTIGKNEDYTSAVKQYAAIIDREAVGGWKFECIRKLPVTKKAGCIASLFGHEDITMYVNMLVFSKDDSSDISSETVNIQSETLRPLTSSTAGSGKVASEAPDILSDYDPFGIESDFSTEIPKAGGKKTGIVVAVVAAVAVAALVAGIAVSSSNHRTDRQDDYHDDYVAEADYIDPVYKDEGDVSDAAKQFCDMAEGVWVDMDSLRQVGEMNAFDFLIIQDGIIASGAYCGEYGRQGQIVDAVYYDDGIVELTIFYPEVNNLLDGYCEPYTDSITVEFDGSTLLLDSYEQLQFEYMGNTIDEAAENLSAYGNYADYDEYSPFYGIWCAAYVSAEEAEDFVRSMQGQGIDGEVIITSEWECLNPTKYYVVTAGRYYSQSDAESALEDVAICYPDAYIKYTGDRLI